MKQILRGCIGMMLLPLLFTAGCAPQKQSAAVLDYAKTDDYARRMFDAIAARDLNAYLDLTVKADDLDLKGQPLMNGVTAREKQKGRFEALISSIEKEGGLGTLQWVKPGQAMGYLKERSEFVGNIYIEVTVGSDAKKRVLEIGPTQEAQHRGRVLTGDAGVQLKTWDYYKANVL
ncbi:MAG: hypothetical protein EPO39_10680 [Candidatus Manganitrophaceae bacterium]|nr:MAG: hypothetical protein EPO39_10680 [Candidatus Manganitrophaceae bacterium]